MCEQGPFSISFVKEDGSIVHCENTYLKSWHSKGRTMNIIMFPSTEIRTVRRCTIIAFNGEEVLL
jgi:hypothetical protein